MAERRLARLHAALLAWYADHRRPLPWRATRDPYRILVSEVMLQQTQVDRVLPYYERFLAAFPDASRLAAADTQVLHRLWKGLGYPSRAERLREACRYVVADRGRWPATPEALTALPGIGPYTAGALACFAFGQAVPLVDTNIARVLARRDRLPVPLARAALWQQAAAEVHRGDPIAYHNALMDLGARICTARAPACSLCPWQGDCRSAQDPSAQQARATPLTARPGRLASAGAGPDDQPAPPRRGRVGVRPRRLVVALVTSRERYLLVPAGLGWGLPSFTPSAAGRERQELEGMLRRDLQLDLLAARAFLTAMVVVDGETLRLQVYRCRLFADDPAADTTPQAAWRWVTASDLVATPLPAPAGPIMDRLRTYHGLSGHRPPVGRVADG